MPELANSTKTEIRLTLAGKFGGRKGLRLVLGEEQPGGASPAGLLGGTGTSTHSDAANPAADYSCSFHLGPSESPTSLAIGWQGKEELTADLNLGDPVGAGPGECVGAPEDPGSHEPWIEIRTGLARPPLGKAFDLPLSLEHRVSRPAGGAAGTPPYFEEKALKLTGNLHFALAMIEPPYYN